MRKMFSIEELLQVLDATLINKTGEQIFNTNCFVSGVSKDTRTIEEGNLYVAIVGENFDGHDFILAAKEKGMCAALVSDPKKVPEGVLAIVVEDTVKALGIIARHYRFKIGCKVIGITGSVGKTSTREMVVKALAGQLKVHSTPNNQNNEIGLPMTILSAPEDTEVMVLEMGMRLRGEISYLTNIACPDIAIITNVGYSHIERLGSRENILLAKYEITEGLTVNGGILLVNGDDELLFNYARNNNAINCVVGAIFASTEVNKEKELNCPFIVNSGNVDMKAEGLTFDAKARILDSDSELEGITLKVNGIHNIRNALFALTCSYLLKIDPEITAKDLGEYTQSAGRGAISIGKYTVINDAYNASPESMEAAFFNLSVIGKGKRKVAALGGILELGDFAPELHEKVGRDCGQHDFDVVFVTGDNADDFIRGVRTINDTMNVVKCKDTEEVNSKLSEYVKDGDVILFKASHAFGFEKLAKEYSEKG